MDRRRRYAETRGWTIREYVDTGISGSRDRRPALDQLLADVAARRVDAVVCWRLDRFGRNLRHLVVTIEELTAAGVAFVSMGESIDTGSPTGRLLLGILGSFAEFERERIRERITAGLARAGRQGTKLGVPESAFQCESSSASPGCQCARPRRPSACRPAGFTASAVGCFRTIRSTVPAFSRKPRPRRLRCSRFGISCISDSPNTLSRVDRSHR